MGHPPPKSLNACVSWDRLLDVLHVVVASPSLPAVVSCPLCKHEQLSILEDCLAGGQWFHCRKCGKTGDMLELAAATWSLSMEGTVLKLVQLGFDIQSDPDIIRKYLAAHVNYRKRLRHLWQQAQPYLFNHSTSLRTLLSELGMPDNFSAERWNAGPAKILGGLPCSEVDKHLTPASLGPRKTPATVGGMRLFCGGKWKETLVWPYYAAPGQIAAFGFLGRQGDMAQDYLFRPANVHVDPSHRKREAGLAMHPNTREIAADWHHTVFATQDLLTYLKVHLRQFEQSNNPVPLVLWAYDTGHGETYTKDAWQMFRDCRIIFWDQSVSLGTLRQAVAIDGWITTAGPRHSEENRFHTYLWRFTPTMLCRQLRKRALPWPKALAVAMYKWTNVRIEDLLLNLQLDALQLARVRKACPAKLRARLDSIITPQQTRGSLAYGRFIVVEREDGWHYYSRGDWNRTLTPICGARLRLAQVVTHKRTGKIVYVGKILFNGEEIPFSADRKEVERNTLEWMRQFLLERGKGFLRYKPGWHKDILSIAAGFEEPEMVQGTDTVGWHGERQAFLLPGRHIGLDGMHKTQEAEDLSMLPAAKLRYTTEPLVLDWKGLVDDYTLTMFWGVLGTVLSNVMAPALQQPTKGIGLIGSGAREMGVAVAREAGCLVRELRTCHSIKDIAAEEQEHRWPICVSIPATTTPMATLQWTEADNVYERNCVTFLSDMVASVKRLGTSWHTLTGEGPVTLDERVLGLIRWIVPAYLRDACARQLKLSQSVISDVFAFAARCGANVPAMSSSLYLASEDGDADSFADVVSRLVVAGKLRFALEGFSEADDLVRSQHSLHIPHCPISQLLAKQSVVLPDRTRITAVLSRAGVLRNATLNGWEVDVEWWESRHRLLTCRPSCSHPSPAAASPLAEPASA